MFILTMDSQSNGAGATQSAAKDLLDALEFVGEFDSKGESVGAWVHPSRKFVLEIACYPKKNPEMPFAFRHYFGSTELPAGSDLNGRYRDLLKCVSSATIEWKKLDRVWVPKSAVIVRGWKGAVYISQQWEFIDWKLGTSVDTTKLDPRVFTSKESLTEVSAELRKSFSSGSEK